MLRRGVALCVVVLALAAGAATLHARSLDIRQFHAEIVVRRSGEIRVTERITVHFEGSWNGIYRSIPVEYNAPNGLNYSLRLQIESVTDANGTPLRYEVDRMGGSRRIKMWVPGAQDATHTIVLTYVVPNGLRFFEEHDELYWNVTGTEWDYPIGSASADVVLPPEVTDVRMSSFAGAYGATESGTAEQVGNIVQFRTRDPLRLREGLTIVVGWAPGVVHRPTASEKLTAALASNSILLVPFLVFFGMLWIWRRHGRDPDPGSIYVRYDPPPDMTPAEAGTLIDDRPDLRDVTATIVDLAVRGYVDITETKQEQLFGLFSSRDYELALLQPEQWPTLKPHERALLQALSVHATNDRVLLSELQNQFYKHLPQIQKHLHGALIESGFYTRRPDLVRVAWFGAAIVTAVVIGTAGAALYHSRGMSPGAVVVAAVVTFIIMGVFGWLMPARTVEGARTHAWLRGFEEFLSRVDRDRLERMVDSPQMFEKYLPFAMAFGVEKNWARAFEGLATQPPNWYHGPHGVMFRPNLFVADLGRMTTTATSAMTSAPRSSSGSSGFGGGGGGGGFSGGGFGGGGGGGF